MVYRVGLLVGGQLVSNLDVGSSMWGVFDMPRLDSVSPPVLQIGKSYLLSVRGISLRNVLAIVIDPANGIQLQSSLPTYILNDSGESLAISLVISPVAATGPRVVRLIYPGGITSQAPMSSNTIDLVAP
jgi:hypothetical protein